MHYKYTKCGQTCQCGLELRLAEFERMRTRRHPTIVAALEAGQVLRDDLGLFGGLGVAVGKAKTSSGRGRSGRDG
jgi:hypothetical protein